MRTKTNVSLVVGIILSVLAGLTVLVALAGSKQRTVMVVEATTQVPSRTQIPASAVHAVGVPAQDIPPGAITSTAEIVGHWTTHELQRGQIIQRSDMAIGDPLTAGLPGNVRAFSISVATADAVAGQVAAGDSVDIIATTSSQATTGMVPQSASATTILQNVTVLSVSASTGLRTQPTNQIPPVSQTSTTSAQQPTTAYLYTLALTLPQIEDITLAESAGDTLAVALDPVPAQTQKVSPVTTVVQAGVGPKVRG